MRITGLTRCTNDGWYVSNVQNYQSVDGVPVPIVHAYTYTLEGYEKIEVRSEVTTWRFIETIECLFFSSAFRVFYEVKYA
jgi:hypothetical protein